MECNVWWMKWMNCRWHNASTAVIVRLRICRYNCGGHFWRRLYGRIGSSSYFHRKSFLRYTRTIAGRLRQLVFFEQSTSRAFFNYLRTGMSTTKTRPLLGTQLTFVIHFYGWCTCNNWTYSNYTKREFRHCHWCCLPASSNAFAHRTWPWMAAFISGVKPKIFFASICTLFCCNSKQIASIWPGKSK